MGDPKSTEFRMPAKDLGNLTASHSHEPVQLLTGEIVNFDAAKAGEIRF